jgi:hypothetical protein
MFQLPKERKGTFIVGLAFTVIFSLLIGFLHVGVLYLFGTPFLGLGVGILLIWLSRIGRESKLLFSLLPFALIIVSFFLFLYIRTAEGETFLIPANYRGEIVVFYDEPCGEPPIYEGGRRLYALSPEGVLITQATKNDGYLNRRFYLVREDEHRDAIPQFGWQDFDTEKKEWGTYNRATAEELTKETVGVFRTYGRETYYTSRNSIGYIVSDYRWFDRDQKKTSLESKRFSEKAAEMLEKCRSTGRSD